MNVNVEKWLFCLRPRIKKIDPSLIIFNKSCLPTYSFAQLGEPHSNIPIDLLMEHENKEAKADIASAQGSFSFASILSISLLQSSQYYCFNPHTLCFNPHNLRHLGNVSEKVVARSGRIRPLKRALEAQLIPQYYERLDLNKKRSCIS